MTSRRVSSAVRRGVAQPLDLLVDRGVLLDVGVRLRDVRLGLVVVVVRDEVLDRVVRQQLAELVGQLGGQRLVRRHHQGRALQPLDQPGGGRGLAGAGRAEQHDVLSPRPRTRRSSSSIAVGWSPAGWKSLTTSKGATRRSRSVVGLTRSPYVARPTGLGARPAADPDGRPGAGAAGHGDTHRPRHRPVQRSAAPQQARGQDVAARSAHGDPHDRGAAQPDAHHEGAGRSGHPVPARPVVLRRAGPPSG